MDTKFFKRKDIIIILSMLILAIVLYFVLNKYIYKQSATAEILYDNTVIETVELKGNYTFSPKEFPNVVFEIKDGSIAFVESDCPDKICVHTGFINKTGQTAVCLPNKLVLKLKSSDNSPDVIM